MLWWFSSSHSDQGLCSYCLRAAAPGSSAGFVPARKAGKRGPEDLGAACLPGVEKRGSGSFALGRPAAMG